VKRLFEKEFNPIRQVDETVVLELLALAGQVGKGWNLSRDLPACNCMGVLVGVGSE
jgi:hypothetical protein